MNRRRAGRKTAFLLAVFALGFFFFSNWIGHHSHAAGADCAVCHLGKLPTLTAQVVPWVAPAVLHADEPQAPEQPPVCDDRRLATPSRAPPPVLSVA